MIITASSMTMDEERLLTAVRDQNPEALKELEQRYLTPITIFFLVIYGGDHGSVEKLIIHGVRHILRTVPSAASSAPPLHLQLLKAGIRESARVPFPETRPDLEAMEVILDCQKNMTPSLKKRFLFIFSALLKLHPEERMLFLLRDQWDLAYSEINAVLPGISENELRNKLKHIRIRFFDFLEREMLGNER